MHWGVYERTVLLSLAEYGVGTDVLERLMDLNTVTKKGWYGAGTNGSTSLKQVLKCVMQESGVLERLYGEEGEGYSGGNFDEVVWWKKRPDGKVADPYSLLAAGEKGVSDGAGAAAAYAAVRRGSGDREEVERVLKMYCEVDTLGMVMVYQALAEFAEEGS